MLGNTLDDICIGKERKGKCRNLTRNLKADKITLVYHMYKQKKKKRKKRRAIKSENGYKNR